MSNMILFLPELIPGNIPLIIKWIMYVLLWKFFKFVIWGTPNWAIIIFMWLSSQWNVQLQSEWFFFLVHIYWYLTFLVCFTNNFMNSKCRCAMASFLIDGYIEINSEIFVEMTLFLLIQYICTSYIFPGKCSANAIFICCSGATYFW